MQIATVEPFSVECMLLGYYGCPGKDSTAEEYPGCARTTGSKKVDDYVWAFVKRICSSPQIIETAIYSKLAELEVQKENLDADIGSRITSYNVCYTKLLRHDTLPLRPRYCGLYQNPIDHIEPRVDESSQFGADFG